MSLRAALFVASLLTATTAQADDVNEKVVGDINALNEALSILMAPTPEESGMPYPELTVRLIAEAGGWSVSAVPLEDATLVLPVGKVILFQATSNDLIYEMVFPDLTLEFTAIPGRIEQFWIKFDQAGTFRGSCQVTCGSEGAPLILEIK